MREFELDADDAAELLVEARSTIGNSLNELDKALSGSGGIEPVADLAHALKGNLLNVGLPEEADKAKDIELSVKAGDRDRATSVYRELYQVLEQLL